MPFTKGHKFYGDLSKSNYFKKGKVPWNKGMKGEYKLGEFAEKSWNWQGDNISYDGLHAWLKRKYGKADKCENPNCPKTHNIFHWSKLKDKEYQRNRENFWMLCIKCHNNYDNLGFPLYGKSRYIKNLES